MNIILNGREFQIPPGATIATLIQLRQIKTPAYAVERNKQVIPRKLHDSTPLAEGDRIEIVVAVGGG